jgi:quercetin dioxygenase-like cupin family protein
MYITRPQEDHAEPVTGDVFVGDVTTDRLAWDSEVFRLSLVRFRSGARTELHVHDSDQVLLVHEGRGEVGTGDMRAEVGPGDIVFTPAGEPHFHGAAPGQSMSHFVVMGRHGTTELFRG